MNKFILLLLFLSAVTATQGHAATHMCTAGSQTFTFSSNADNDIIIATSSCTSLTVNCGGNGSGDGYCEPVQIFAAAQDVTINCTSRDACRNAEVYIGEMQQAELDIMNANLPGGVADLVFTDFEGVVDTFDLNCSDSTSDRDVCRGMTLRTFEAVKDQTINCELGTRACAEMDASLYNLFLDGSIALKCGGADRFQCDAGTYELETVADMFTCTGITCVYIGCASVGCSGQTPAPDILDTDSDGTSSYYDNDSDNDGVSDEVEIALGTDPEDPNEFPTDGEIATELGGFPLKEAQLLLTPTYAKVVSDCVGSTPSIFTLTNNAGETRKVSSANLVDAASSGEFSIDSNSCPVYLADGASCDIAVSLCASDSKARSDILTILVEDSETPTLQAALYTTEALPDEAERRLPPALTDITMTPAAGAGAVITVGTPYDFSFDVIGYDSDFDAWVVVFQCAVGDLNCGSSYATGTKAYVSNKLVGSKTTSTQWQYDGLYANEFAYTTDTSFTPTCNADYVIRLYRRSADDVLLANGSLSLLLPGNLVLPSYSVDKSGRRLTVTATGGIDCP